MASASTRHPEEVGGDQAVDVDRIEQGALEGENEMTGRDILILLGVTACVVAATVLTWWLAERAFEYFLRG